MANEKVVIDIEARTDSLKKAAERMKQIGGDISNIGVRVSAAFTLPIIAIGRWVLANEELKKSLEPIGAEFTKIRDELATALLPVIKELMPSILELVRGLGMIVTWFGNLDTSSKKTVLTFLAIIAAIGPAIVIVGQLVATLGSLQALLAPLGISLPTIAVGMKAIGASAYAALGPVGALLAALGLLAVVIKEFGPQALQSVKQLAALTASGMGRLVGGEAGAQGAFLRSSQNLGLTGRANGGPVLPGQSYLVGERGPEVLRMGASGGMVTPATRSTTGSINIIIQAQNLMGDAEGIKRAIEPAFTELARAKGLV